MMVVKESLPEVNEWIDLLFKFHLSHKTLHFYIILEFKMLISICNLMHKMNESSNDFCISNAHSLNIIQNMITEYATINKAIARAIGVLWKDTAIATTFELIKSLNRNKQRNGINTDDSDNFNKLSNPRKMYLNQLSNILFCNKTNKEYNLDIEFCEYFFENCQKYAHGMEDDTGYSLRERNVPSMNPIIFDQQTWKDCNLLKQHIINQSNGKGLLSCNIYFNMWKFSVYMCVCVT